VEGLSVLPLIEFTSLRTFSNS